MNTKQPLPPSLENKDKVNSRLIVKVASYMNALLKRLSPKRQRYLLAFIGIIMAWISTSLLYQAVIGARDEERTSYLESSKTINLNGYPKIDFNKHRLHVLGVFVQYGTPDSIYVALESPDQYYIQHHTASREIIPWKRITITEAIQLREKYRFLPVTNSEK